MRETTAPCEPSFTLFMVMSTWMLARASGVRFPPRSPESQRLRDVVNFDVRPFFLQIFRHQSAVAVLGFFLAAQ